MGREVNPTSFPSGKPEEMQCSGHTHQGHVTEETLTVSIKAIWSFYGYHEVNVRTCWMSFLLATRGFLLWKSGFLKTLLNWPAWSLPYRDIFHLFSGSFPQVFSSFFHLSTTLLMSPSITQWGPGTTFSQFSQPSSRWDTPGHIMYQRPEKPSFEVEEFSAIYPSSFLSK